MTTSRITGIIRKRKCSRIGNFFLIREKTFANCENPSRIYSFPVQLPISPLATPIFPTKVATVEALQSNMRQCSSYSGHTHLQLLNRIILPKHSNTAVEYSPRTYVCSLKTSNLHPSDLRWNAYRSHSGFSTITAQCLSRLDLHLWAGINKAKKWKFSKKIFANTLRLTKFANIFFRELFPLYGNSHLFHHILAL